MIVCKNCGLAGTGKFCSECGYSLNHKRITLPHLLHEVVHTFTHFENGYLYVIKQLTYKPGIMQKKYLAGYRVKNQSPFPMFVISGTICALVLYLTNKSFTSAEQYFTRNYYVVTQAALLPVYALVTWLLFFSSKLYYAEALVLVVYMIGFMLLISIPINVFSLFLERNVVSYMEMVVLTGYNIWTYINFFNDKPAWAVLLKSLMSFLICYLLFQMVAELLTELIH